MSSTRVKQPKCYCLGCKGRTTAWGRKKAVDFARRFPRLAEGLVNTFDEFHEKGAHPKEKKMDTHERDYEKELGNICNGIAESVLDATDEEIDEEIRLEGLDPKQEADKVRQILRDAVSK